MDNKKTFLIIGLIIALAVGVFVVKNKNKDKDLTNEDINEVEVIENNEDNQSEIKDTEENDEKDEKENSEEVTANIEVGKKMRDFVVEDKSGEKVRLKDLNGEEVFLDDYEGDILLINFWATWCVYCDAEMPDLQKLQENYDDVKVIAVNVLEDEDIVKKYIDKGGYDFRVALDKDGIMAQDVYVSGFPATYFVDKDGTFLGRVPSMITYDQMVEIVEDIKAN
ncbi:MAG TPA: TlpA disulfide reductase family protein [Tissierellaceae bacterium]